MAASSFEMSGTFCVSDKASSIKLIKLMFQSYLCLIEGVGQVMHSFIAEAAHNHSELCGSGPLGLGPCAAVYSISVPKVLNALYINHTLAPEP